MQSLNEPDPKEALLASDARLVLVAQNVLGDPIVYQGKAEVMEFFQGYEHADSAREFLSVDGRCLHDRGFARHAPPAHGNPDFRGEPRRQDPEHQGLDGRPARRHC